MESAGIEGVCVGVCVVMGEGWRGEGQEEKKVEWGRGAAPMRGTEGKKMGRKTRKSHGKRAGGLSGTRGG